MNTKKNLLGLQPALLGSFVLFTLPLATVEATIYTWECVTDVNWGVSGCWNPNGIPTSTDSVRIGTTYSTSSIGGSVTINSSTGGANALYLYQDNIIRDFQIDINLTGGTLNTSINAIIGESGYADFNHSGGTHTVTSTLFVGANSGSNGDYRLSGTGSLTVNHGIIGYYGNGRFFQTGGTHDVATSLMLGQIADSDGYYYLSNGSLTTNNEIIGYNGSGGFDQIGGTHTITNVLNLASNAAGSRGTYNLDGGSLTVGGYIANGAGYSAINVNGGTLLVGGGNGSIDVDILAFGNDLGESGSHTLSGTGSITTGSEYIGVSGTGSFTQSSGMHTVTNTLTLGDGSTGNGTYNLNSGDLSANREIIGAKGTGTFNQSNGTHTVTNEIIIASDSTSTGTYNLSGGNLIVNTIHATNTGSQFNFTGGTLTVKTFNGDLVNNGGTLNPGDSPGATTISGDYTQLLDGIYEIEIGGLAQGTEYDWLDVDGTATLGGTLEVSLFDLGGGPFNPSLGDSFDILAANTIVGKFDLLTLALLDEGLMWDVSYIFDDFGTDYVRLSVSQVPVPAAVWLFSSGLIGLIGVARRKRA